MLHYINTPNPKLAQCGTGTILLIHYMWAFHEMDEHHGTNTQFRTGSQNGRCQWMCITFLHCRLETGQAMSCMARRVCKTFLLSSSLHLSLAREKDRYSSTFIQTSANHTATTFFGLGYLYGNSYTQ